MWAAADNKHSVEWNDIVKIWKFKADVPKTNKKKIDLAKFQQNYELNK